jgi:phage gpG-like protein
MTMFSLTDFAARLAMMEADIRLPEEAIVEKAAQMIEERARDAIGTYEFGWPQLAEATQQERERLGFTPNDPLRRTGRLKYSIGRVSGREGGEAVAYVGTNDPNAKYHEFGTSVVSHAQLDNATRWVRVVACGRVVQLSR